MMAQNPASKVNGHLDIHAVLDDVSKQYVQANPESLANFESNLEVMPGANTRAVLHASPFPLTITRGESAFLFDADGHEYLDFLGEYSAGIYGHSSPVIKRAVIDAMDQGWNFGNKNKFELHLARLLLERFSYSMDLIRFCNSGTEANMMALGAAISFTGKKKILVFLHGYHGGTVMFHEAAPKYTLNAPYDCVIAPYNDVSGTEAIVETLPVDSLAAVIVEPMQVAGGCIPGTAEFLQYLRDMATAQKAILIFDEVMTSRLDYGGLQVKLGIKPDITTIGKWAGGGMSFGAFGGRRDIMDLFDPRSSKLVHSGTFNNNVLTMAAGIAGSTILDKTTLTRLNAMGDQFRADIAKTIQKSLGQGGSSDAKVKPKMWVTGLGSLFAVRFDGSEHVALCGLFYHYLLTKGIHIAPRCFLALHLEITEEHCARFVRAVDDFIDKYRSFLV